MLFSEAPAVLAVERDVRGQSGARAIDMCSNDALRTFRERVVTTTSNDRFTHFVGAGTRLGAHSPEVVKLHRFCTRRICRRGHPGGAQRCAKNA